MNKYEKKYLESNDSATKQQQRFMWRRISNQNLTALTRHWEFLLKVKKRIRIQNEESHWSRNNNICHNRKNFSFGTLWTTCQWYVFNNTYMVALVTSAVGKQYGYLIWELRCFVITFHYNFWLGKSDCYSICYL